MKREVLDRLKENKKFHKYLRENSNYYKYLNRDPGELNRFIKDMKIKYKLRVVDKVDNIVDTVDLVTKILN